MHSSCTFFSFSPIHSLIWMPWRCPLLLLYVTSALGTPDSNNYLYAPVADWWGPDRPHNTQLTLDPLKWDTQQGHICLSSPMGQTLCQDTGKLSSPISGRHRDFNARRNFSMSDHHSVLCILTSSSLNTQTHFLPPHDTSRLLTVSYFLVTSTTIQESLAKIHH